MSFKNAVTQKLLSPLAALTLLASPAHAVESIQLEHVPIDASWGCERVFFKSSQNFTGTIYALPIVIPGTDKYGETIMTSDVDPNRGSGNYLLNFELFFPNDDKAMRDNSPPEHAPNLPKCDFDIVKDSLNKYLPQSEQIHTISYMPLTSIEVTIPEYLDEGFLIGQKENSAEADLIAYQGANFNVTLRMDENEKSAMLNALSREEGLQARVRVRFKAHKQNGALKVTIDMSQLATAFKVAAKGQAYMVQADIQAALQVAMSEQNQKIMIQEGSSESFNDLVKQMVDKVLEEVKLIPEAVVEDREAKADDPDKKKISVAIVADVVLKKIKSTFSVVNSTAEEVATAEIIVPLQAALNDPSVRTMRVASGEYLSPTLSEAILLSDSISITGSHYVLEQYEYKEIVSFVTSSDLRTNYVEIGDIADLLVNDGFHVELEVRNGVSLAVGYWQWWNITELFGETTWKRIERVPVLVRSPKVNLDNTEESYDRFPIYVAFSQVGGQHRMFTFNELLEENEYWSARYDKFSGSIVLTAKKDLGLMSLIPRYKLDENNDRGDMDPSMDSDCKSKSRFLRMDCYLRDKNNCDPYTDSKTYPTEKQLMCWDVDHRHVTAIVEEIIQTKSNAYGSTSKKFTIRKDGKASTRQRVVYYNITLPKRFAQQK